MSNGYSIAPGAIEKPDVSGGPDIILADPQWVAVQEYVVDGEMLPTTEAQFRNSLGPGAPKDLSDFQRLIAAYSGVHDHCTGWRPIFNNVVELAGHVYDYGNNLAPVYYPPILTQAKLLEENPGNKQAQQTLAAILDVLEKKATEYAGEAGAVFSQLQQFAQNMETDQNTLVGGDGHSGLLKYYEERYASTSKTVEELMAKIKHENEELEQAEEEYRHDVIVAATTPTYAWIWPVGTVAGAIVAGIYGKKATEALRKEEAIKGIVEKLEGEERADAELMATIEISIKGVKSIEKALAAALPVIYEVEGAWKAMATDLGNIAKTVEQDIAKVPPIIMNLGVDAALKSWYEVAAAADKYRKTAYIVPPTAEMHQWKLAAHLTAPAPAAVAA